MVNVLTVEGLKEDAGGAAGEWHQRPISEQQVKTIGQTMLRVRSSRVNAAAASDVKNVVMQSVEVSKRRYIKEDE